MTVGRDNLRRKIADGSSVAQHPAFKQDGAVAEVLRFGKFDGAFPEFHAAAERIFAGQGQRFFAKFDDAAPTFHIAADFQVGLRVEIHAPPLNRVDVEFQFDVAVDVQAGRAPGVLKRHGIRKHESPGAERIDAADGENAFFDFCIALIRRRAGHGQFSGAYFPQPAIATDRRRNGRIGNRVKPSIGTVGDDILSDDDSIPSRIRPQRSAFECQGSISEHGDVFNAKPPFLEKRAAGVIVSSVGQCQHAIAGFHDLARPGDFPVIVGAVETQCQESAAGNMDGAYAARSKRVGQFEHSRFDEGVAPILIRPGQHQRARPALDQGLAACRIVPQNR